MGLLCLGMLTGYVCFGVMVLLVLRCISSKVEAPSCLDLASLWDGEHSASSCALDEFVQHWGVAVMLLHVFINGGHVAAMLLYHMHCIWILWC